MSKIREISKSRNYTAINAGDMDKWKEYSMIHPKSGQEVRGKVFLKEATRSTGTEISLDVIPPKSELPYFHTHRKNEETYIILKGTGYFQVDEDCFPIEEGSIVRVAPEGNRGICNMSDREMVYICIQSKENSLEEYSTGDGERVPLQSKW
ncbi:MAG: cupin domain-containing protein [Tannerellaceae bacterium]|jgi:mannose-6-phosphate isomerase-like protein (cupin superfamily)|nr:cupin domain-containing protein [Tannerellaceae bacterium]